MAALYPNQDAFTRGELSPRLHARASLDLYRAGLSVCQNFITLPHGGIRKRGGSYFAGEALYQDRPARLIPFVFSSEQAYCLEFGHNSLRVYAYGSRVGTVELATPWPESVLREMQFIQSADVMWITHDNYPTQVLTRTAHTSWSLAPISLADGPFDVVNADESKTMQVSAVTGAITITANHPAFTPQDVGRLVRVGMTSYANITPWEPNGIFVATGVPTAGRRVRYEGNVYVIASSPDSAADGGVRMGATPPTHLKGTEPDGPGQFDQSYNAFVGMDWMYLHSGYGVAIITGYTSPTAVTASVIARFPEEVVGVGSSVWRMGAFGRGEYPSSVSLFEERLAYSRKFSVYASKTGAFNTFRTGQKDDDALEFIQAGGGQANDIVWIADADGFLLIATTGGIRALSGSGIDEALTPSSFKNRKSRTYGCARIRPVDAGSSFLYVTRSRKAIAELTQTQQGRFASDDLGQISEHIPKKGVIEIAFQTDPDPILWFPLENGELGGFTHQPAQEVRGMHRHRMGGVSSDGPWGAVESVAVTPGQTGADDVWLLVRRTIGGVTRRYIEVLQCPFEYDAVENAFQVDSGLSRTGSPVNAVSGLAHLNGESVDILADGKVYKSRTVASGSVSLPGGVTASKWHVGLPMPAEAATLELDVGGRDGSMMGRRKKVAKVILSVLETDTTGLEISSFIRNRWEPVKIPSVVPSDGMANLETRNIEVLVDDSWEGQARIRIRHSHPTPCTIRAMTPVFEGSP